MHLMHPARRGRDFVAQQLAKSYSGTIENECTSFLNEVIIKHWVAYDTEI